VEAMQISIVAKTIGLSVDVIRFYERNGLLPRPPRTEGGFRRYEENDVETLAFVRRVQRLGLKLSEIRGLLRVRGNRLQPCPSQRKRAVSSRVFLSRVGTSRPWREVLVGRGIEVFSCQIAAH